MPLDAVQQVAVAVPAGGRLDRRHVRARALLGDRVALLRARPGSPAGRTAPADRRWRRRAARTGEWPPPSASALVTRPTCSWTSTCCRVVQPPPPSSAGMLVAHSPSSRARAACAAVSSGGSSPPASLGGFLERDQLVGERRGPALDLQVGLGQPVHSVPVPPTHRPAHRPSGKHLAVLTECSVYASIGLVPMASPCLRTPRTRSWSAAGRSAAGARTSCARRALTGSCCWRRALLGQGASSRAAGVVRLQGGTPKAVRLAQWSRRFYLGQRAELGTDSGFVSQGYLLPCFTAADVVAARQRLAMQARARDAGALAGAGRGGRGSTRPWHRGRRWAAPSAPTTGTSARRATSPPTPSPCSSSGVTVAEQVTFTGLVTGGQRRSAGGADERRAGSPPASSCSPGARSWPRWARWPGSASRRAGSGTRSRSPSSTPTCTPPGCRWSSTCRRAVLAAGGGRAAVRDEQPGRAAGRDRHRGRGLPGPRCGERLATLVPVTARPRAAPDLGGHHRLHPRPPADHRAGARPGRRRWPGSPWPARAAPG